jgi:hypothetical protein
MKINKTKKYVFLILLSFFVVSSAHAQLVPCGIGAGNANCTLCHLVIGFKNIYDYLLEILLVCTTVVIVAAGIMYMVSSGSKGMIEKAKSAFTYALTAMILALVAWLIINATLNALGYRNAGNWWTFTCDTTQSKSAGTLGAGGATLPGNQSGKVANLTGRGCAGVVQNAKEMVGMNYSQANRDGASSADCSSVAYRSYQAAGCNLPTGNSGAYYSMGKDFSSGQQSFLNAGDLLIRQGHVAMCLNDGCTQVTGARGDNKGTVGVNSGIYVKDSGHDIKTCSKVIKASDYCSGC